MIFEAIRPIPDAADQLIDVVLSDNPYTLRILWNERAGYWGLSIFERDGPVILENIKMVKDSPLIGRYKDTRLPGGEIYFVDKKARATRPGFNAFNDYVLVYFVPDVAQVSLSSVQPIDITSGSIWDDGLTIWDDGLSVWDV